MSEKKQTSPDDDLMSVKDVALYLKVSECSVRRWTVDLGGYKLGHVLRFKRSLVDAYVESRKLGPSRATR
jgi:excisionase family DNA binding protein